MDEMWGPVVGCLGFTAIVIAPFIVNRIIKFKLEIAKINAETTIRTEEIRARNQLEIEKLVGQEQNTNSANKANYAYDASLLDKRDQAHARQRE